MTNCQDNVHLLTLIRHICYSWDEPNETVSSDYNAIIFIFMKDETMIKKMTLAVLGFGQRGVVFSNVAKSYPDEIELVAACEKNTHKHAWIKANYHLNENQIYSDFDTFMNAGKLADILVISTMDQDHHLHALKALEVGYDILLEKPIALSKKDIFEIKDLANKLNRKIAVAHVLRYTHFYNEIKKLIDQGVLGSIATLHQTENVGYLHYAHSFVRGNWHNSNTSSPMILAKSCHDIDIIRYLVGKRVEKISSFGNLHYFKKENMPKNAAKNCIDCKVDCPFNAIQYYEENPSWMAFFSLDTDAKKVLSDRNLNYGRCVYDMDNNVVDHQVLNMQFEDGSSASFTMTAFSYETHRRIEIKGTKAELVGDLEDNLITVMPFGKPPFKIDIKALTDDFSYHSGGDKNLLIDFVRAVRDNTSFLTDINYAVESHYLAFDAETSRLNQGLVIDTSKSWSDYER